MTKARFIHREDMRNLKLPLLSEFQALQKQEWKVKAEMAVNGWQLKVCSKTKLSYKYIFLLTFF